MVEQDYKKSSAWQKAVELVEVIANLTKKLAKAEGMMEQAAARHVYNRDAEAIALDIATAGGRAAFQQEEARRFLSLANGMACRLEARLLLDAKRDYLSQADAEVPLKLCAELTEILTQREAQLSVANRHGVSVEALRRICGDSRDTDR